VKDAEKYLKVVVKLIIMGKNNKHEGNNHGLNGSRVGGNLELDLTKSLFYQIIDVEIIGGRIGGEPEVLYEIEDICRAEFPYWPIIRNQIKRVLEFVPSIFSENWKSPEGVDGMNDLERRAYFDIGRKGMDTIPGPAIQRIIELGIGYRTRDRDKNV